MATKVPTVHLNGTGRTSLLLQMQTAHEAAHTAIEALYAAAPHGRDYYTQDDGAYSVARTEHLARLTKLQSVRDEIMELWEGISNQGR